MCALRTLIGLVVLLCFEHVACSQVILTGSTASLTGQPTTTGRLVDIDMTTGTASNPRNTGIYAIAGMSTQPGTGVLFALGSNFSSPANSLLTIEPSSGVATVVGSTGMPLIVEGDLAFHPTNGFLYGVQDLGLTMTERNFFRINSMTGASNVISNLPLGDYSALAFNGLGALYAIDSAGNGDSLLLTIDPSSGAVTNSIQMNVNLGSAAALAIHPLTGVAYVADGGDAIANPTNFLFSLNIASGSATPIGSLGIPEGLSGLSFVSIPEPSSVFFAALPIVAHLFRRAAGRREPSEARC